MDVLACFDCSARFYVRGAAASSSRRASCPECGGILGLTEPRDSDGEEIVLGPTSARVRVSSLQSGADHKTDAIYCPSRAQEEGLLGCTALRRSPCGWHGPPNQLRTRLESRPAR